MPHRDVASPRVPRGGPAVPVRAVFGYRSAVSVVFRDRSAASASFRDQSAASASMPMVPNGDGVERCWGRVVPGGQGAGASWRPTGTVLAQGGGWCGVPPMTGSMQGPGNCMRNLHVPWGESRVQTGLLHAAPSGHARVPCPASTKPPSLTDLSGGSIHARMTCFTMYPAVQHAGHSSQAVTPSRAWSCSIHWSGPKISYWMCRPGTPSATSCERTPFMNSSGPQR